jgi:transcriptional repressor NrdR
VVLLLFYTIYCVNQRVKKRMLCPYCSNNETKVTDKRDIKGTIKRRRECLKCSQRFSTKETPELQEFKVLKKNDQKEVFDIGKIKKGIEKACEKRHIDKEKIEKMVLKIERRLKRKGKIVKTSYIGELISNELKKLDNVAYIRFASVYRDFADISDFKKEIRSLIKK